MATSAVDALRKSDAAECISGEGLDEWLAAEPGLAVLLFSGVSKGRPEGHDAAVALRECQRLYPGLFRLGVVDDADEDRLKGRFRVIVLPSIVFLSGGEVLQVVPRIRDWAEYAELFRTYLGTPPRKASAA